VLLLLPRFGGINHTKTIGGQPMLALRPKGRCLPHEGYGGDATPQRATTQQHPKSALTQDPYSYLPTGRAESTWKIVGEIVGVELDPARLQLSRSKSPRVTVPLSPFLA